MCSSSIGFDPRHSATYFFNKRLNITQVSLPNRSRDPGQSFLGDLVARKCTGQRGGPTAVLYLQLVSVFAVVVHLSQLYVVLLLLHCLVPILPLVTLMLTCLPSFVLYATMPVGNARGARARANSGCHCTIVTLDGCDCW